MGTSATFPCDPLQDSSGWETSACQCQETCARSPTMMTDARAGDLTSQRGRRCSSRGTQCTPGTGFDDSSYNGESFTIRAGSPDRHVDLSAEDDFEDFDEAIQSYSCSCRN